MGHIILTHGCVTHGGPLFHDPLRESRSEPVGACEHQLLIFKSLNLAEFELGPSRPAEQQAVLALHSRTAAVCYCLIQGLNLWESVTPVMTCMAFKNDVICRKVVTCNKVESSIQMPCLCFDSPLVPVMLKSTICIKKKK